MALSKLTRLSSLKTTLTQYKKAKGFADHLWAQLVAILPDITPEEVDTFLRAPKPKVAPAKVEVSKLPKAKVVQTKVTPSKIRDKISESRRAVAHGEIPSLKKRIKLVMGSKEMRTRDIIVALKAKNWLPDSTDISTYMSYTLSSAKDDFERVSRGKYRVIPRGHIVRPKIQLQKKSDREIRQEFYTWALANGGLDERNLPNLRKKLPQQLHAGWTSFHKLNRENRQKELKNLSKEPSN